jgi:hypothetical protein
LLLEHAKIEKTQQFKYEGKLSNHSLKRMDTPVGGNYIYVRDRAGMERLVQRIRAAGKIALDTEADSLLPASTTLSIRLLDWN